MKAARQDGHWALPRTVTEAASARSQQLPQYLIEPQSDGENSETRMDQKVGERKLSRVRWEPVVPGKMRTGTWARWSERGGLIYLYMYNIYICVYIYHIYISYLYIYKYQIYIYMIIYYKLYIYI